MVISFESFTKHQFDVEPDVQQLSSSSAPYVFILIISYSNFSILYQLYSILTLLILTLSALGLCTIAPVSSWR